MSGSLPGKAILHQRQLGLFSMVCHLTDNPINKRALHVLTNGFSTEKSWFTQLRDICLLYGLPHPIELLLNPLSKESFKKLVKSKITDYWETKLRLEVSPLLSMSYFKPEFHSLVQPHPILWTAGPNPYEVSKAIIQCRMLSGRYRTELLARHWSRNRNGYCLSSSLCNSTHETLDHILLWCPAYHNLRERLMKLWLSNPYPHIKNIIITTLNGSSHNLMQFLLDPSTHPQIILLAQNLGDEPLRIAFYLTRTWCFSIHRERAKILGRWL